MQQNMTEAQKQFVRLNPTVGYEQDTALENEIDLAIDFCLSCDAPLARFVAEKQVDDLPVSDPSWLDTFNAEADKSFGESFDALLREDEHRSAGDELDALRAELRRRNRGAA
jgi:hypothetical protein